MTPLRTKNTKRDISSSNVTVTLRWEPKAN